MINKKIDDIRLDAINYRLFRAARDAALDGKSAVDFDMGNWCAGTAVAPIVQMAP